jgi:DNA-binding response OmpR family regulator
VTTPDPSTAKGGKKRIVVVEDDAEIRDLEGFLLSSEGYDVVLLPGGAHAAETVKQTKADLVLLDLMLPDRDGNAVLADMEADPETADVPVIVVSAFDGALEPSPLVRRVIAKPFEVTDLLDGIAHELGH